MSFIKISLIIVNWNGKKWLKKNLDSLYSQTYKHFEIILVDNNSKDNSVLFVKKKYPRVKIIKTENKGFGHAANLGAVHAIGDFLMFFNEDMYVDDDFLANFIRYYTAIKDKHKIGTIGCDIQNYNSCMILPIKPCGFTVDLISAPMVNYDKTKLFHNTGSPMFTSRKLFLRAGGFCPNIFLYSEDIDYCWRLNIMGYQHYFIPNIYIYHYGGGVIGSFSDKKLAYYIKGEINCILNNYSFVMLFFVIPYFLIYYSIISLYFLLTFKINYAKMVWLTIYKEIKSNWLNILRFRQKIQAKRRISDLKFIKQGKIKIIPTRILNIFYYKKLVKKYGYTR